MMGLQRRVMLALAVAAACAAAQGVPVRIDAKPGAKSLLAARDRARKLVTKARAAGVEIVLAPGTYRLDEPLELDARDAGVTWRTWGKVTVCDGVELPSRLFRAQKKDGIYVADLSALELSQLSPLPKRELRMPLAVPDLYVDGEPMTLARWPNEGWATIERVVDPGTERGTGNCFDALGRPRAENAVPPRGATFVYSGDRPVRWADDADVFLHGYWRYDWYDSALPLGAVNAASNTITLAAPHWYGLNPGNPSPRRWYACNLLSELDAPGEYFVDVAAKKLYLRPRRPLGYKTKIVLVVRDRPLVRLTSAANVVFRGLSFAEAYGDAVEMKGCAGVRFERCEFHHLRKRAVAMTDCRRCTVEDCRVYETGTGGVVLDGGDFATLTPSGNAVVGTQIRDYSRRCQTYASAVELSGVGNRVADCEVCNAPHHAIGIKGNDNLVENCVVSNVCRETDDTGAIYQGRNPAHRGTVIRGCLFADIGSSRGHGSAAIYFDDGDCGNFVRDCVFLRCGDPGKGSFGTVFSHGGHSNLVEGCVFADCKRPLGSAPWTQPRWAEFIASPKQQQNMFGEACVTSATWLARYPAIAALPGPEPDAARWNAARHNLFVDCHEVSCGRWALLEGNVSTSMPTRVVRELRDALRRLSPGKSE